MSLAPPCAASLAVFDALLVLQADTVPVPIVRLLAVIGDRAAQADVLGALADLKQRALPGARPQSGWRQTQVRRCRGIPGQAHLEGSSRSGDQLAGPGSARPRAATFWTNCSKGHPWAHSRRRTRRAIWIDPCRGCWRWAWCDESMPKWILPRHVVAGAARRTTRSDGVDRADPVVSTTTPDDADAAAAGAVIDLLRSRRCSKLGATPAELRSGGLGFVNAGAKARESTSRGWA